MPLDFFLWENIEDQGSLPGLSEISFCSRLFQFFSYIIWYMYVQGTFDEMLTMSTLYYILTRLVGYL